MLSALNAAAGRARCCCCCCCCCCAARRCDAAGAAGSAPSAAAVAAAAPAAPSAAASAIPRLPAAARHPVHWSRGCCYASGLLQGESFVAVSKASALGTQSLCAVLTLASALAVPVKHAMSGIKMSVQDVGALWALMGRKGARVLGGQSDNSRSGASRSCITKRAQKTRKTVCEPLLPLRPFDLCVSCTFDSKSQICKIRREVQVHNTSAEARAMRRALSPRARGTNAESTRVRRFSLRGWSHWSYLAGRAEDTETVYE